MCRVFDSCVCTFTSRASDVPPSIFRNSEKCLGEGAADQWFTQHRHTRALSLSLSLSLSFSLSLSLSLSLTHTHTHTHTQTQTH
jgi:hypothetical protein